MLLDSPRVTLAAAAALAALLVILATLQHRWLDQVAEAERDRTKASLAAAAHGFAADFDREISHLITCFEPGSSAPVRAAERLTASWRECAARSGLQSIVFAVYTVETTEGGTALERLDPSTGRLEPIGWPAELAAIRARLAMMPERASFRGRFFPQIDGDVPALVLPESLLLHGRSHAGPPPETKRFLIVRLDVPALRQTIFPDLARRYFGSGSLQDYELAVIRRGDPSRPIYVAEPGGRASAGGGDASADLLTLRIFAEAHRFDHLALHSSLSRDRPAPPAAGVPGTLGPGREWRPPPRAIGEWRFPGAWRLLVTHRDGSLEAAIARARRRSLGVGLGILGVLAGAVAMTVVSARRAQSLARQQIDFVAAVSHELHTPLAAIRSAGQNLADGVVTESGQVRRYGSLIENEGRRLTDMVTHVLDFSGIQSGRRHYRMRPVAVEDIVDSALAECRLAAEQRRIRIDREIADDLPHILADADALGRALRNLIDNAIKYGGGERWMRVRAEAVPNGDRPDVAISVEDRGPGVRDADRQRIFEPFYRGENSASIGVAGSGLGLALVRPIVEAHGGTITVESNRGNTGARFVIRVPGLPPGVADEGSPS